MNLKWDDGGSWRHELEMRSLKQGLSPFPMVPPFGYTQASPINTHVYSGDASYLQRQTSERTNLSHGESTICPILDEICWFSRRIIGDDVDCASLRWQIAAAFPSMRCFPGFESGKNACRKQDDTRFRASSFCRASTLFFRPALLHFFRSTMK